MHEYLHVDESAPSLTLPFRFPSNTIQNVNSLARISYQHTMAETQQKLQNLSTEYQQIQDGSYQLLIPTYVPIPPSHTLPQSQSQSQPTNPSPLQPQTYNLTSQPSVA